MVKTVITRIILAPVWLPILLVLVCIGIAHDVYGAIVLKSLP